MQYKKEVQYWRNVLKRAIAVVQFLSQRGLDFFGDNECIGMHRMKIVWVLWS